MPLAISLDRVSVPVGAQGIAYHRHPGVVISEVGLEHGVAVAEPKPALPLQYVQQVVHLPAFHHEVCATAHVGVQPVYPVHGDMHPVPIAGCVNVHVLDVGIREEHVEDARSHRVPVCYGAYVPDDLIEALGAADTPDLLVSVREPLYDVHDDGVEGVGIGVLPGREVVLHLSVVGHPDQYAALLGHVRRNRLQAVGGVGYPAVRVRRLRAHVPRDKHSEPSREIRRRRRGSTFRGSLRGLERERPRAFPGQGAGSAVQVHSELPVVVSLFLALGWRPEYRNISPKDGSLILISAPPCQRPPF